ncbi:hypothetical protein [Actinophytocola sediminis]
MITPQAGPALAVPVVGTVRARGTTLVRRLVVSTVAAAVVGGLAAGLMPWGLTVPWLTATSALVLAGTFTVGLRRDLRSVGQLWVTTAPSRQLVLRGPWVTREHDLDQVLAVQVWCGCGPGGRKSVAPHRDGLEVVLRGGRAVQLASGTVFAPDVAMTLSELLGPAGVKVVDWGETDVLPS